MEAITTMKNSPNVNEPVLESLYTVSIISNRDQSHRNLDTLALERPFVKVVEFVDINQTCIGGLLGHMIKSPTIDFHARKLFIYD